MRDVVTELAGFCRSIETVGEPVLEAARRTLLDTIGVAASGASTLGGRASREAAPAIWGEGTSKIWFSKRALTPPGAAFVNATYAASLDLDDGHRGASGHPAAAIIPAVLALATGRDMSAVRLLSAIAIAYEVSVRIAASRDINGLRTTDTGLWCGYGTAAAAGWLLGHPAQVIAHAMSIAGQTASGQFATGWTRLGHTVKEGIPWAAANGVQAAFLAAAGHSGPVDLLDDNSVYDRARLLGGIGQSWAVEEAYFKRYSCCRWAHAAIDAALRLQREHHLEGHVIDRIVVETFDRALTLPNQAAPASSEAAQYSIPFCVAVALLHGEAALLPFEDRFLFDPEVVDLASRVRLEVNARYAGAFPATTPARVIISFAGGSFALEVTHPKGELSNRLSDEELARKFDRLASRGLASTEAADAIRREIADLGYGATPASLLAALSSLS